MGVEEALQLVAMLEAAYPAAKITDETAMLYAHFLADLDPDVAKAAVARVISTSTFWPSIAELRKAAAELQDRLPEPEEAWEEVLREANRCGDWDTPRFSHPLIERAVRAVGFRAIQYSEALGVERAHFLRVYEALRTRAMQERQLSPQARELVSRVAAQLGAPATPRLPTGGAREGWA